jgi:hypothetical protein
MLQNTEQNIPTVNYSDLIPGKVYLIQCNLEGPESQDYNTRFRGKFVKYEVGKRIGDDDGLRNLPQHQQVALFEDVEILSKNKEKIYDDIIWVVSENPTSKRIRAKSLSKYKTSDAYSNADDAIPNADEENDDDDNDYYDITETYMTETDATRQMLEDIRNNIGQIAFDVNKWTFAESFKELDNKMKRNILNHLSTDGPNPNDTIEQQKFQIKQREIFRPGGPIYDIAEMAGIPFEKKTGTPQGYNPPESDTTERNTSGTKRKADEIEIGGRKRSRRNRRGRTRRGKTRRGKTRKGKARKGRTRKHRRHYRK